MRCKKIMRCNCPRITRDFMVSGLMFITPITLPGYIYKTIYMFLSTTNAYWLRVNHTSNLPGFKPQTRKECLQDPLTRKECLHTRAQGGERGEEKRGRVREPQRLGLSQGTMNREPKYEGGHTQSTEVVGD